MLKTDQLLDYLEKYAVSFFINNYRAHTFSIKASNVKYVLLGEASHGTSEFYRIRSDMTKQLIQEHVFSFIAVERRLACLLRGQPLYQRHGPRIFFRGRCIKKGL